MLFDLPARETGALRVLPAKASEASAFCEVDAQSVDPLGFQLWGPIALARHCRGRFVLVACRHMDLSEITQASGTTWANIDTLRCGAIRRKPERPSANMRPIRWGLWITSKPACNVRTLGEHATH